MSGKRSKRRRHLLTWAGEESINLTPLLDVIFNLIFFFLLATTLRQTQAFIEVDLPSAKQAAVAEAPKKKIEITLTVDNRLYLNDREVDFDELENRLREIDPEKVERVILKGDAGARHENVVRVLDICSAAGHLGVSVEVRKQNP